MINKALSMRFIKIFQKVQYTSRDNNALYTDSDESETDVDESSKVLKMQPESQQSLQQKRENLSEYSSNEEKNNINLLKSLVSEIFVQLF